MAARRVAEEADDLAVEALGAGQRAAPRAAGRRSSRAAPTSSAPRGRRLGEQRLRRAQVRGDVVASRSSGRRRGAWRTKHSAGLTGEGVPSPCTAWRLDGRAREDGGAARPPARARGRAGAAASGGRRGRARRARRRARRPRGTRARAPRRRAPSGFLRVLRRAALYRALGASIARWRRRRVDDLVHIGIGGSALGAELLFRALAHPLHNALPPRKRRGPRVHFVDNVDPERLAALLETLDPARTLVHVVSKSGSTVETAAGWQVVRGALERRAPRPALARPRRLHRRPRRAARARGAPRGSRCSSSPRTSAAASRC